MKKALLVLTLALVLAVATAPAALACSRRRTPPPAPGTTVVKLAFKPSSVPVGQAVVARGSVSAVPTSATPGPRCVLRGVRGVEVSVLGTFDGSTWETVGTAVTNRCGDFALKFTPSMTATYQATFSGDATFTAGASRAVRLKVHAVVTRPRTDGSVLTSGTDFSVTGTASPDGTVTVGVFTKGRHGRWKAVTRVEATVAGGSYVATLNLPAGKYRLVAFHAGADGIAPSCSKATDIRVKPVATP